MDDLFVVGGLFSTIESHTTIKGYFGGRDADWLAQRYPGQ
jgi:hypothetical protein